MTATLDINLARRVLEVVDAGLSHGQGKPIPGQMCVEAAVCYALDEPHGDEPSCVGAAVRSYKITLNDSSWPSNASRAAGMRAISVCQLGSNEISQEDFASLVAMGATKIILPPLLLSIGLGDYAEACRSAVDLDAARAAAAAATAAARAAGAAARAAGAAARAAALDAARAAARDAGDAAGAAARAAARAAAGAAGDAAGDAAGAAAGAAAWAAAGAAGAAARDAGDAAGAAAWAAAWAAAGDAGAAAREQYLILSAQIGVDALRECGCKGVELWDQINQ